MPLIVKRVDADRQARAVRDPANGAIAADIGALFEQGRGLFNDGRYFECHEAWEAAWKHLEGDDRRVLQGLIQAAAALLHLQRGNAHGALSLLNKSQAKFASGPARWQGIELQKFAGDVEIYIRKICEDPRAKGDARLRVPLLERP
jgi:predicted metal-dependent hydrolase